MTAADKALLIKNDRQEIRGFYMAAMIPSVILGRRGQCVKSVSRDEAAGDLVAQCRRDARFVPVDHRTDARGTVNRRLCRCVRDLSLGVAS